MNMYGRRGSLPSSPFGVYFPTSPPTSEASDVFELARAMKRNRRACQASKRSAAAEQHATAPDFSRYNGFATCNTLSSSHTWSRRGSADSTHSDSTAPPPPYRGRSSAYRHDDVATPHQVFPSSYASGDTLTSSGSWFKKLIPSRSSTRSSPQSPATPTSRRRGSAGGGGGVNEVRSRTTSRTAAFFKSAAASFDHLPLVFGSNDEARNRANWKAARQ